MLMVPSAHHMRHDLVLDDSAEVAIPYLVDPDHNDVEVGGLDAGRGSEMPLRTPAMYGADRDSDIPGLDRNEVAPFLVGFLPGADSLANLFASSAAFPNGIPPLGANPTQTYVPDSFSFCQPCL